jgi:hypothetical protein
MYAKDRFENVKAKEEFERTKYIFRRKGLDLAGAV